MVSELMPLEIEPDPDDAFPDDTSEVAVVDVPSLDAEEPTPVTSGRPAGKVIVLHSAKGGVGTTTMAVNIAAAIHARGQRVCLLDLDLGCGDVAVTLRLEARNSIIDVLADDSGDDQGEPIDTLRTTVRAGFDCILAPAHSTEAHELPAGIVGDLIVYLCTRYDAIVIDTPATMSVHSKAAFGAADALVLVATPEVSAVRALAIGVDRASTYGARTPIAVLNHVQRGEGMPASEIGAAVGVEVAIQVPRDPGVVRAGDRGEAVVTTHPAVSFSAEVERLVDRWCGPKKDRVKTRPLHRRRVISL